MVQGIQNTYDKQWGRKYKIEVVFEEWIAIFEAYTGNDNCQEVQKSILGVA